MKNEEKALRNEQKIPKSFRKSKANAIMQVTDENGLTLDGFIRY